MSKRNRDKRSAKTRDLFPFRLLQCWVRSFESGLPCKCGAEAHYSAQSFSDLERWQHLQKIGYTDVEAMNMVWDEALTRQLNGNYTVGHVTNVCQRCALAIIAAAVGDDVATLAMLPMMLLGELSSVVVGAELSSRDDDGRSFAAVAHARNLDDLLVQLRGEAMSINLAGSGV